MMFPQRVGAGESPMENKLSNGPLRASEQRGDSPSIRRREGIRKLPGICWYLKERGEYLSESRWHRELFKTRP